MWCDVFLREGIISICVQWGYFINNIVSRGVHLLTGIAHCVAWSSSVCILKGSCYPLALVYTSALHWSSGGCVRRQEHS